MKLFSKRWLLYLFQKDAGTKSTCGGACAVAWLALSPACTTVFATASNRSHGYGY